MRNSLLLATVTASGFCHAQDVPAFNYSWTASGKQYATVGYPLEQFNKQFSFDFVAGTEVKTSNAPALGLGFNYELSREKWFAKAGVFVLFPQKSQPDFGIGLTFGVRF